MGAAGFHTQLNGRMGGIKEGLGHTGTDIRQAEEQGAPLLANEIKPTRVRERIRE